MDTATEPEATPRRPRLLACLTVAGLAALSLLFYSPLFELGVFHVDGLNDQVGYITSARWYAETGELRSHLIYPAFIDNPEWRLYMPGHYVALASSYLLLGDQPITWRLPSLVAFVLSSVLVYACALRLYGRRAGLFATGLFLLFPPNVAAAFTAMAEPAVQAVSLLGVATVLFWPRRTAPFILPFALGLPFLYRETSALLILPLAVYLHRSTGRPRATLLGAVATVLFLGFLGSWQARQGKESFPLWWITLDNPNYADALLESQRPEVGAWGWIEAIGNNVGANASEVVERVREVPWESPEPLMTLLALGLIGFALLWGLGQRSRDGFPLATGLFSLGVGFLLFGFHKRGGYGHVTLRHLSITVPFTCIAFAAWLSRLTPLTRALEKRRSAVTILVPALLASVAGVWNTAAAKVVASEPRFTEEMEKQGHDDTKILICPARIGMDFVLKHYPVRWAFIPENPETLRRIAERYEIGTLVTLRSYLGKKFTQEDLAGVGLRHRITHGDLLIFSSNP